MDSIPRKKRILTEEHKRKLSVAFMGVKNHRFGKPMSEDAKEKMRQKKIGRIPWNKGLKGVQVAWNKGKDNPHFKGENNPNWKGGITPINQAIRTSRQYKEWRISVFERDHYRCFDCGAKNGEGQKVILHADHIYPFALYPRLRFDINNGRTLCIECHKKTPSYAGNFWKNYAATTA